MARINIEEEAWKRIYRLADLAGCDVREAAGTVSCLWNFSQDLVKTHGSREEIMDWANLFKLSPELSAHWIECLEKSRFIFLEESGQYLIRGNESQIKNRLSYVKRGAKGAKALQKKVREMRAAEAQPSSGSARAQLGVSSLKARQGKAKQISAEHGNADQGKTIQSNAVVTVSPKSLTSAIWDSYFESYLARYKAEPVRNDKVNSQIKQLAKRLGQEAPDVVRFYVEHPKDFYVRSLHPIGACLQDAEALRTQWIRGKAITERDMKRYAEGQQQAELHRAIDEGTI